MSVEGFRQGDAPATVYFNILVARVYRRLLAVLDGRGVLFAIADDVKISAPPAVTGEVVEVFADIAWTEAGLKTQVQKNRIYVQQSAQAEWAQYLDSTPRSVDPAVLCIHDIPDGSFLEIEGDADSKRIWPTDDGINILGTPLGSPEFIESYLFGKGIKHRKLLSFIQDVAAAGFPREAAAMLTGAAGQRLTHLLKSIRKNPQTVLWMKEMDAAHVSTWLHCLTASSDLEYALDPSAKDSLTGLLDLPPSYGGIGLQSLERAADEEFLGSFASISASLISFCRRTALPVYMEIAVAIESMGDTREMLESLGDSQGSDEPLPTVQTIKDVVMVAGRTPMDSPSDDQLKLATELVRGHSVAEVPGRWVKTGERAPDPITLPEPRSLSDYVMATCKQECSILKQARHVRQAHHVFSNLDPVRKALMRAAAGQCGRDSAHCSLATVEAVARMDCPASLSHSELSEGVLFCAATLHRFGLPYDYANLENCILPESCACCSAPLWDPGQHPSRADRIFVWQAHLGRCGGDGRRIHAHEVVKLALKKLVLSSSTPAGCAFPPSAVLIEPRHLRQDNSRPGDLYAIAQGMHRKDTVMDLVITSGLKKSCLTKSITSSDFVIKDAESKKFRADANSRGPVQLSATRRLVPLAMNHLGLRGAHFESVLKEFATSLVSKPAGCGLMQGPFALSINGALRKIIHTWGSRLTWTAQREHAAQIVGGIESFKGYASFVSSFGQGNAEVDLGGWPD
jgi:hypothetical protein